MTLQASWQARDADAEGGAMLAFRDVACARGGRMLFEGLSFAIAAGGAAVVTGPNGVGKSSLLRVAAGLLAPLAGSVEAAPAALLAEGHALDAELPLGKALGFWARLDGGEGALTPMLLGALADVPVRLLSTGQRRRAGIARVAASGVPLWLLDEPANGLDAEGAALLAALIARHRAQGGAVLAATHLPLDIPDVQSIEIGR